MITKEAIEAAAKELLAHGEFGTSDGANRRNAVVAAEAALTAALEAMPWTAVKVKPLGKEFEEAIFSDVETLYEATAITPAPDLAAENDRLRAALESIIVDCQGASVCGEAEMGLDCIYHKASEALERT